MSHTEISLKWSGDLKARTETINSQKRASGECLHSLELGNASSDTTPKAQAAKGKQTGLYQNLNFVL